MRQASDFWKLSSISPGLLEKVVPGYLSWSKFVEFPDDGSFVLE